MADIRDSFFDAFYEIGAKDQRVIFLTDDMDAFSLRRFKQDFPDQFINVGVAEQNIINVAAGLAMCGKNVFVYGICSFITMRCYEQIKVNLCSMNLPVTIVGSGAGFSFGFDGPTHHGTQDVALMRSLPEMSIINLSDLTLASQSARIAYESSGPLYIRLDKGDFPELSEQDADFSKGYRILRPLRDVNLVSTGYTTLQALSIADTLGKQSIELGVIDLFRLKPIGQSFAAEVLDGSKKIAVIEENSIVGGCGSAILEIATDYQMDVSVKRFAIQDKQFMTYGSREWFFEQNRLSKEHLLMDIVEYAN